MWLREADTKASEILECTCTVIVHTHLCTLLYTFIHFSLQLWITSSTCINLLRLFPLHKPWAAPSVWECVGERYTRRRIKGSSLSEEQLASVCRRVRISRANSLPASRAHNDWKEVFGPAPHSSLQPPATTHKPAEVAGGNQPVFKPLWLRAKERNALVTQQHCKHPAYDAVGSESLGTMFF